MMKITGLSFLLSGILSAAGSVTVHAVPLAENGAAIETVGYHGKADGVDVFEPGARLFSDRDYVVRECPDFLNGKPFLRGSIGLDKFTVVKGGLITVLTPESNELRSSQAEAAEAAGFTRVADFGLFQLFGDRPEDQVRIYRKKVEAGEQYEFRKWAVVLGFSSAAEWVPQAWDKNKGELLYNGIRLPKVWPPVHMAPKSRKPMPVPYLDYRPNVVPIDVGRQLFVDDFLIEKTDLERTFHYPVKYNGNPVLKAETDLEKGEGNRLPGACPKSGGLWWDSDEQVFKLWYEAGWLGTICYATSTNGLDWGRPELDILPGSNQVLPLGLRADSWTVVRDWWTDDPAEKYKLFVRGPGGKPKAARCFVSPDGIHWGDGVMSGSMGDRSTMFYNPFRQKWVFSLRSSFRGRSRHYWEGDDFMVDNQWEGDFLKGQNWREGQPVVWAAADELDPPDGYIQDTPQLYNLDAVAYESIMLGFYQIHRGPDNGKCKAAGVPKITELNFAYSRDGFHWDRPDRTTAIPSERKAGVWDHGYVQSLGNICVLRGDTIWFYYAGYAGDREPPYNTDEGYAGMYGNGAMGVAFLRRDGFASMDARTAGSLTTRPVTFGGKHLFVNAAVPEGTLRAEVLDERGKPIKPFTLANSVPFSGDRTIQRLTWKGGRNLSSLKGRPVRFRFELENGAIYSFWVSRDKSGRSDGYVAGGGPGYTGPTDTVGTAALDTDEPYSALK